MHDVIDRLVEIEPGSKLDGIRAKRQQARDNAQASYQALFEPAEPGDVSREERFALALFVTGLHRTPNAAAFYAGELRTAQQRPGFAEAVLAAAEEAGAEGPAGRYREAKLGRESTDAPVYRVGQELRQALGPRLAAALQHAHMLIVRPREASRVDLQELLDAGWSTTAVVTISQIVAFLAFQLRVVAGLAVVAALPDNPS